MIKNLCAKNAEGKWWTYGQLAPNQWGNDQVSFKLDNLKKLVAESEAAGKEWVNLSLFDKTEKKESAHYQAKANGYQPQPEPDMDDGIPF